MRTKFAILLTIAAVCVTTAWAGWSPEGQITSNRLNNDLRVNINHKVVVASNGVRHLVWFDGKQTTVYYKRYYTSSGWTPDYRLTTITNSWFPSIALDANGTDIHVVWDGDGGPKKNTSKHIYYQKCVPGSSGNGGWVGTPRDLTPNGYNCRAPVVADFRDGNNVDHVVVAWFVHNKDTVGFCECVAGNWGAPQYFHVPSGTAAWSASIAVDPQTRHGDVFISCTAMDVPDSPVFVRRRIDGVWQQWEDATTNENVDCYMPVIEVDPSTGYPHIVCSCVGTKRVYHTYCDPVGGWQPLEMVSSAGVVYSQMPSMSFSGGSAFVVWAESSSGSDRGIRYIAGNYGNWSTPAWVTSGYSDEYPSVTARSNGDVYVVWKDGRNGQIWGRLYAPGTGGGQAQPTALSQSRIELFPNPAKAGRVTVQYSLPRAEPVRVTLLDVSGRAVRTQEVSATDRSGSFNVDVSGLNAGVYVARLVAGDLSVSKSLVVER